MKTQPRQHISNKYYTCTIVTSPVYIGSKTVLKTFHTESAHNVLTFNAESSGILRLAFAMKVYCA